MPDRAELARSLKRLAGAGWRLTGASDHLVSEALYLRDPEGNGIEIYRDPPREEWRREGDELAMATLPLDLEAAPASSRTAMARSTECPQEPPWATFTFRLRRSRPPRPSTAAPSAST